jgi:hypothetical protein
METKEKHPLVLGPSKTESGYTVFKNVDEELVSKIKALNVPSETWIESNWLSGAKGVCRIDKKLNDNQFLCVDEHGHYFVKDANSFEDTNRNNLLNKINNEFSVADYLNENMKLFTHSGYAHIKFLSSKTDESYDALGRVSKTEIGYELDTYDGITLKELSGKWCSIMFCFFNEEGNIENRDYNIDFKDYFENKPKTREDLINGISSLIPDVEYKHAGNKWFSNSFAFVLDESGDEEDDEDDKEDDEIIIFRLNKLPHKSGDNYGDRYYKARVPLKFTEVKRDSILERIIPLINKLEI